MTLAEIKAAIDRGEKVYWSNTSYHVIKDKIGQYVIKYNDGYCIGLTWDDGITLNGKEPDFFTENKKYETVN